MLTIRDEQMRVFDRVLRERAKGSALEQLRRERQADLDRLGEEVVDAWLESAVQAIQAYGGRSPDLPRYLGLMFEFGPDFPKEAWAAQVLTDPDIPGNGKLDVLGIYASAIREGRD